MNFYWTARIVPPSDNQWYPREPVRSRFHIWKRNNIFYNDKMHESLTIFKLTLIFYWHDLMCNCSLYYSILNITVIKINVGQNNYLANRNSLVLEDRLVLLDWTFIPIVTSTQVTRTLLLKFSENIKSGMQAIKGKERWSGINLKRQ